jgi:hypothetical protein
MGLPNKTMLKRLFATALCVVALNVYVAFAPPPVRSMGECTCMTCNRCENGQRCICLKQGTECIGAEWTDDPNGCKCKTLC